MSKLIVLVGIPGSGKSYIAEKLAKSMGAKIFSSDSYREKLFGNVNDQEHNETLFKTLYSDMTQHLSNGEDAILDSTNLTLKGRRFVIESVKGIDCEKIAYMVATPIEICLENNKTRDRVVPEYVIYNMAKRFQIPMINEGFDDVVIHTGDDVANGSVLLEQLEKMSTFDQKNPHHKYRLMEHCMNVAKNYSEHQPEYLAGVLHDIGKLFTQEIDDDGVAHYYSHDSIGAYYLCANFPMVCFLYEQLGNDRSTSIEKTKEIIFFVNWHMRAHKDLLVEKAEKKYRNIFGDELFDRLIQFAEYDKIASGTYEEHQQ